MYISDVCCRMRRASFPTKVEGGGSNRENSTVNPLLVGPMCPSVASTPGLSGIFDISNSNCIPDSDLSRLLHRYQIHKLFSILSIGRCGVFFCSSSKTTRPSAGAEGTKLHLSPFTCNSKTEYDSSARPAIRLSTFVQVSEGTRC
ncbi:hypothetical protein BGZ60DRAFT_416071 [Tricladium varicosporioides]|nr:hypothetical protein BGZ60DRAFT_416071 [Hymenoscyphus varicosporioides]